MLSTKNIVSNIRDVPTAWVFSYYCKVPLEHFNGVDFKIRSVFAEKDRTPSMSFYVYNETDYRFNDFSTGIKGNKLDLVMNLLNLDLPTACGVIVSEYNTWRLKNGEGVSIQEFKTHSKYKVESYEVRKWSKDDAGYWSPYNISSKILDLFNVKALDSYTMVKDNSELKIVGNHLYGYFKSTGELYKIYQPKTESLKFMKVGDFIQGSEQLSGHDYLLYLSSLKDIMSAYSFGLRLDYKAPDSENTLLSEPQVKKDKTSYKKVLVMFDNDEAGVKAANKYKDKFGIQTVFLNYGEKDLSDHVKQFGVRKARQWFIPLIDKKLNEDF